MIQPGLYSRHGDIERYLRLSYGEEFRKYREFWLRQGRLETLEENGAYPPANLLVELIDACDMKCTTCSRNFIENRGSGAMLSVEQFSRIMAQAAEMGIASLSLPDGEPMLHPRILEMLACVARQPFQELLMYSNGSRFDAPRRAAVLDCARNMVVRMHISLDAITGDTYRRERGGDYDLVMDNIDAFLSEGERLGERRPLLWVSFLLKESNRHEAEAFREYWLRRADIVEFQKFLTPNVPKTLDPAIVPKATFCSEPFRRLHVTGDGTIQVCCGSYRKHWDMGHIDDVSLTQAWNGEKAAELRRSLKEGHMPPACRNCLALAEGLI